MIRYKCPHLEKVTTIIMVVMAFFIVSCEKRIVIKEPLGKRPPVVKPPEERPTIAETPEEIPPEEKLLEVTPPIVEEVEVVTPEEIPPEEIPPEEITPIVEIPPEEIPAEEKLPAVTPPVEEEVEIVTPEEIPTEEIPPEEIWPEREVVIDYFLIAENYFRQQEYDMAIEAYEQYLKEFPLGDKVKEAIARIGTIYYHKNQYKEAISLLQEALKGFPLNTTRAEVHLLIAKSYYHLGEYSESRQTALRWLELYKDYPNRERIFSLLGQTSMELNDYPMALYWWIKRLEAPFITDAEKEELRTHLINLISQATEDELEQMAIYAEGSDLIIPINARLSLYFLHSDRLDEARKAAEEILRLAPNQEWISKGEQMLKEIDERLKVSPNVIGCLLPLSGPFAIYGQEVLHGLELGLDIFRDKNESLPSVELVIRDTAGDPSRAIEAIEELKEAEKAIVIIGPLISKVADVVVEKAQESGMPIITLSQSEGITNKGEMVFQNCLAPEDQIKSLTNKVIDEIDLKRFAILYPANPYGTYFMNKFWDEVESKGGVVNAVESYDPQGTDFATEIKKIVGLYYPRLNPDMEEEGEDHRLEMEKGGPEEEPEPIIDFDAVFIPDSHQRAALIASQLVYHDVVGVTLLGTNLWNSHELIEIAGRYMHGAIFPSGFFSGSGFIGVEQFVEEYKTSFGQEPGLLAAIGYDTIRIVKEILKEKGDKIKTRSDFRAILAENDCFEGVTGTMTFDTQRRAKRDPLLLTISGSHFLPMP